MLGAFVPIKRVLYRFDGTLGTRSSLRTNGCDHAQSEHLQFGDPVVGLRIFRSASLILVTLRSMRRVSDGFDHGGAGEVQLPTRPR